MSSSHSTALAKVEDRLTRFAADPTWQRLWLSLESQNWRSLAIVPAGETSSIDLVHALAAVAWHQRSTSVIVADLRTIGLPTLATAREELRRRVGGGDRVLIGMNSLEVNPTSATIARDADKAVLCVFLGRTSRAQLRDTVRELGIQRCLGSIVIRTNGR